MIRLVELSHRSIDTEAKFDSGLFGAEITFLGIVRGIENGFAIEGIDYSAYASMALGLMEKIADDMERTHGPHPLVFHHTLGFVAVGRPSVVISVAAKHSAEAFDLCQEYLRRLKQEVPIWKRIVTEKSAPAIAPQDLP